MPNLTSLDARFKEQHLSIIDLIEEKDETTLAKEQDVLDVHDEAFSSLLLRAQQLIKKCTSASETENRKVISRNLTNLQECINKMEAAFTTLSGRPEETHLYHHYQEGFKSELGSTRQCSVDEHRG